LLFAAGRVPWFNVGFAAPHAAATTRSSLTCLEGFQCAKQHRPDVVRLDLNMPGLSGRQALQLLKRDVPESAS
jgi:CheY-like chemotaxis protein